MTTQTAKLVIALESDKYVYSFDEKTGASHVTRYGEPWRDTTGDKFVLSLAYHARELEEWKASTLRVEQSWDPQAVARLIGVQWGDDIRKNIQPAIEKMIATHAAEIDGCINLIPEEFRVQVREGGGPENKLATLASSISRLVAEKKHNT